jgi:chorismate synthase
MNSLGKIFRLHIFGESHGPAVGIVLDGVPAGINLSENDFAKDIDRRKGGKTGTTSRKEEDKPVFLSGVFNGKTTGSPLAIVFENRDVQSKDYINQKGIPRPGHADLVASKKFGGHEDFRGGGHFSGRLTACLVAAGVVAKKILFLVEPAGTIQCNASVIEVAGLADIEKGLQRAVDENDSAGGIVECKVINLPLGLGQPFFDSVESLISHATFAIPAVKGIEFGNGFLAARLFGSNNNDPIIDVSGKSATNNAGGISGGLTNGNDLVFRVAVKPASSTPKEQRSFSLETGEMESFTVKGRHDLCIALRVPIVLEAVTACALVDLLLLDQKIKPVY